MKSEERFTGRVDNYVKYRPGYPEEVYDFLVSNQFFQPDSVIADIGCGTGISSELFLKHGHDVFGVEPNPEMLEAALEQLREFKNFKPVQASAEKSGLTPASVDLIVVAQAFHWLDQEKAKKEFRRILKAGGKVLLMWNDRRTESSDFLKVYEDFLQMFGTDYKKVDHKSTQKPEVFEKFFEGPYASESFSNLQCLDFEGLKGRVLSSSYMPDKNHSDYDFMMYCLKKIFTRYQEKNKVCVEYDTRLYIGSL